MDRSSPSRNAKVAAKLLGPLRLARYRRRLTLGDKELCLRALRDHFNKSLFDSRLIQLPLRVTPLVSQLGRYTYKHSIEIAVEHFDRSCLAALVDTLLHELCHQYAGEVLKLSQIDHGPAWQRLAAQAGCRPRATAELVHPVRRAALARARRARAAAEPLRRLRSGRGARYFSATAGCWIEGVLAGRRHGRGGPWALAYEPRGERWLEVEADALYRLAPSVRPLASLRPAAARLRLYLRQMQESG